MKFTSIAGALVVALLLAGCEQATSGSSSNAKSLTVNNSNDGTIKYYDLTTGTEVSSSSSSDWDVGFAYLSNGIYTNSGDSGSGSGGVYYTNKSVFDDVTSASGAVFNSSDWAFDTSASVTANGSTSVLKLNKMTKLVYDSGDGSSGTPFVNGGLTANYAGDATYSYDANTHAISSNNHVYIIRHGDGAHYSKFQVTTISLASGVRTRVIKYETF